jgi:hypothetical protein
MPLSQPSRQYGAIGMRMGAIFEYVIHLIISLRVIAQEGGYLHALKPMQAPRKVNFRQDMDAVEYVESA